VLTLGKQTLIDGAEQQAHAVFIERAGEVLTGDAGDTRAASDSKVLATRATRLQ